MNKKRMVCVVVFVFYALHKSMAQQNTAKIACTEYEDYILTHELTRQAQAKHLSPLQRNGCNYMRRLLLKEIKCF